MVQRENRFLQQEGNQYLHGGTDGQGKDREQNMTEKRVSTRVSDLIKVKVAL